MSGHSLACETGRWNKRIRGRLPMNERLCECGSVQTERHVKLDCPRTQHIRDHHQFEIVEQMFSDKVSMAVTCKMIHATLSVYLSTHCKIL